MARLPKVCKWMVIKPRQAGRSLHTGTTERTREGNKKPVVQLVLQGSWCRLSCPSVCHECSGWRKKQRKKSYCWKTIACEQALISSSEGSKPREIATRGFLFQGCSLSRSSFHYRPKLLDEFARKLLLRRLLSPIFSPAARSPWLLTITLGSRFYVGNYGWTIKTIFY